MTHTEEILGGWRERRLGGTWLLGFESISLAKHKPEEMGSLLCAFTVVCCCCCCWELTRRETACLYMAPKCTLSALTEADRGQRGPQLLISQTERKHFVRLTKTQFTTQHTGGGQRQHRVEYIYIYIYLAAHTHTQSRTLRQTEVRSAGWDKPT